MMVEGLPVKKRKRSLEVVAVFTDHPRKIKLDNPLWFKEITVYILSIEFFTYLLSSHYCSIYKELFPHLGFTSCEALTLRVM